MHVWYAGAPSLFFNEVIPFHDKKRKKPDPAGPAWDANFCDFASRRSCRLAARREQKEESYSRGAAKELSHGLHSGD
jgi:hypothetical protein